MGHHVSTACLLRQQSHSSGWPTCTGASDVHLVAGAGWHTACCSCHTPVAAHRKQYIHCTPTPTLVRGVVVCCSSNAQLLAGVGASVAGVKVHTISHLPDPPAAPLAPLGPASVPLLIPVPATHTCPSHPPPLQSQVTSQMQHTHRPVHPAGASLLPAGPACSAGRLSTCAACIPGQSRPAHSLACPHVHILLL
jgi:hypothetical protein